MSLKVEKFVLGAVRTNTYIAYDEDTKEAVIVDPADKASYIKTQVEDRKLKVKAILLTHGHFDHIMAVKYLRDELKVPVIAHSSEKQILNSDQANLSSVVGGNGISIDADNYVEDNEVLECIGQKIKVIHTPGHTVGSVCYFFEDELVLFSGDTLFRESMGRTDFPTGNISSMQHSLKEVLAKLDDKVTVYPGHEGETTIGYEKMYNPFFG